jgi:hypothetical protein
LPRCSAAWFGRFALWAAAWITAALVLTASVIAATAQIQTRGAAELHAQMQNAGRHFVRYLLQPDALGARGEVVLRCEEIAPCAARTQLTIGRCSAGSDAKEKR